MNHESSLRISCREGCGPLPNGGIIKPMTLRPIKRLLGRLAPFRWPLAALAAGSVLALVAFGPGFFGKVATRLADDEWWADNVLIFLIFSGLTTWLVSVAQKDIDRRWRRHFEGWRMEMVKDDTVTESTGLHWDDAEKYLNSEIERWRAIKGFMSTLYHVNTPSITAARASWLDDPMDRVAALCTSSEGYLEPPDDWTDRTIRIRIERLRVPEDVVPRKADAILP